MTKPDMILSNFIYPLDNHQPVYYYKYIEKPKRFGFEIKEE